MTSQPRITVVVATYNSGSTLQSCFSSVFGQIYPNKELIVIDGGSSDNTVELIESNEHGISYWVSEPDRGVYHAWNKALAHVTGDWIQFVGSDDYFVSSDVLAAIAAKLQELGPEVRLAYGKLLRVTPSGDVLDLYGQPWNITRRRLSREMSFPHGALFHHRSLFERYGHFDESFRIAADYEFVLRTLDKVDVRFFPDITVIAQRNDGMSSLPASALERNSELARARRLNGLRPYPLKALGVFLENYAYGMLYRVFGIDAAFRLRNVFRRLTGRPPAPIPR